MERNEADYLSAETFLNILIQLYNDAKSDSGNKINHNSEIFEDSGGIQTNKF